MRDVSKGRTWDIPVLQDNWQSAFIYFSGNFQRMKFPAFTLWLLCITMTMSAQKQRFDRVSFMPPKGWKKESSHEAVV